MSSISYEQGDARDAALPDTDDSAPFAPAATGDDDLLTLSQDQYWEWLASLIEKGSIIDQELDELLDDVYDCQSVFYSISARTKLRSLLDDLQEARTAVRAYENDVEELTYVFARSDAVETQAAENADMALAQIKQTYNRAYDLCLYKLDRMSSGWITASNFLISIIMLVVTILFWMEFR